MSLPLPSRRLFVRTLVLGAASVPLVGLLAARPAVAQDLPPLDESAPQAAALGYKHDTLAVDAAKYPRHTAEQICDNCNLIQGAEGAEWRPCAIFPGRSVAAQGWCAAWVPKP